MATLKTYLASPIFLTEACRALGQPHHMSQVALLAVAPSRADAAVMVKDRRCGASVAREVHAAARVNNSFNIIVALRSAGLAPADVPAIYVMPLHELGLVLRIEQDGTYTPIANVDYDRNAGALVAVPVAEVSR